MLIIRAVQAAGSGTVDDTDRLLTAGPHALTRNPMYLGWALLDLGAALVAGSGWLLAAELPAALAVYRAVLSEEQGLEARFGAEFARVTGPRSVATSRRVGRNTHDQRRRLRK